MGEHWLCRHALKCQISQLFAICVTPMELSLIYIGKMMSHLFVVKPNVLKIKVFASYLSLKLKILLNLLREIKPDNRYISLTMC